MRLVVAFGSVVSAAGSALVFCLVVSATREPETSYGFIGVRTIPRPVWSFITYYPISLPVRSASSQADPTRCIGIEWHVGNAVRADVFGFEGL